MTAPKKPITSIYVSHKESAIIFKYQYLCNNHVSLLKYSLITTCVQQFAEKMAVEKRLAFSIVQFLRDQTHCGALNSDEQESLEGKSDKLTCYSEYFPESHTHTKKVIFTANLLQSQSNVWRPPLGSTPVTATWLCHNL